MKEFKRIEYQAILDSLMFTEHKVGLLSDAHINAKKQIERTITEIDMGWEPLASEVAPGPHKAVEYFNRFGPMAPRGRCCDNGNFEDDHACQKQPGAAPTEPQVAEAPDDKHEREMLEVIDERDKWEERLGDLAVVAGCKEEWSNLHEHGDCIEEEILSLREQLEQAKLDPSQQYIVNEAAKDGASLGEILCNYSYCTKQLDKWKVRKFSHDGERLSLYGRMMELHEPDSAAAPRPQEPRCPRCKKNPKIRRLQCNTCGGFADTQEFFSPAQIQGAAPEKEKS